jgi:hypothetical protein
MFPADNCWRQMAKWRPAGSGAIYYLCRGRVLVAVALPSFVQSLVFVGCACVGMVRKAFAYRRCYAESGIVVANKVDRTSYSSPLWMYSCWRGA